MHPRRIEGKQAVVTPKEGEWDLYYPCGKKNAIEKLQRGETHGAVTYFYPIGSGCRDRKLEEGHAARTRPGTFTSTVNCSRVGIYRRQSILGEMETPLERTETLERIIHYQGGTARRRDTCL